MEAISELQCDHCKKIKIRDAWVAPESCEVKLSPKVDIGIGPPTLCPECREKETQRRAILQHGGNGHNGHESLTEKNGFGEDIYASNYTKPVTKCLEHNCANTKVAGKWLPEYTVHFGQPAMLGRCPQHAVPAAPVEI